MFLIAYAGASLIVVLVVMWLASSIAKARGKSPIKWALLAVFALFVLVVWDYYPTIWAHRYYCEKDAGFWVYTSADQWKKENPEVMETLVANKGEPSERNGDMVNYTDTYFLNQRFNLVVKHSGQHLLNRWRHERELVDTKTNGVLGRYVDFSTSQEQPQAGWSGWKFWLDSRSCETGRDRLISFGRFYLQFKGAEK
ncbi:MAG: hypothetical protein FIA96_09295 [Betaproteobacteria bacterium]|nr:hypothetical protein [Betaproteobacteria bacterium]